MRKTLLIMAAGMGSRYGGLKQIEGFGKNKEPLFAYAIHDAEKAGCEHVIFIIRESFAKEFKEKVKETVKTDIDISYVYQDMTTYVPDGFGVDHREKPWGTGHAVLCAKDIIDGPCIVINADDWYGVSGYKIIYDYMENNPENSCLLGYQLDKTLSPYGTVNRGVCKTNELGYLSSVKEHHAIQAVGGIIQDEDGHKLPSTTIVSMNFWGFNQKLLGQMENSFTNFLQLYGPEAKKEFYIQGGVMDAIDQGQNIYVCTGDAQWSGVTYKDDKEYTEKVLQDLIKKDIYTSPLFASN